MICLWGVTPCLVLAQDVALAVYGGRLTRDKWESAISPTTDFADATIMVTSFSWTAYRFLDGNLSCEWEAQAGKYVGDQDHWEFNLPILAFRWHRFPWDQHLATSFAWGIGPSYATRVPKIEIETNDSSNRWLVYWFGELTLGPPTAGWEVLIRLHHRSDAFGIVADDGGSNALCAGVRWRF